MQVHLTLIVDERGPGELRFTCLRGDPAGVGPRVWRGDHEVDRAEVEAERQALLRAARRAQRRGDVGGVTAHGRLLFDLILPATLKRVLREADGGALLVAPGPFADMPWPLLDDGVAPLGLRWALGEIPREGIEGGRLGPLEAGARLLVVADPAGDLPAARFEGEALMQALAADGRLALDLRLGRLRRADFLRIFKSFRMIHFAGHADPASEGRPAGWRLADGPVGAAALEAVGGERAPALVFVNACRSAGAQGLVDALLDAGVRHVVATDVDLPDLPGADFAVQFYKALQAGASMGAALRRARAVAAEAGDAVWTAYRLFGDPRTVYFDRRATERWAPGVRRAVVLVARAPVSAEGPEALAEVLAARRDAARAVVQRHGGRLLPGRAAALRAVFGVPFTYENDAERAARAALELCAEGGTVVLEAGPLVAAGLEVVGAAALAAEAACWRAEAGVYVLPGMARRLGAQARLGPGRGLRRLRSLVTGAPPDPPLVGRLAELARLEALADTVVAEGRAQTAIILGPAGMGKSRLAAALAARVGERLAVIRGASIPYDEDHPYAAAAEVVRATLQLEDGPDLRGRLEAALARLEPARSEEFVSIDALLAGGRPRLEERLEPLAAVLGLTPAGAVEPALVPVAVREVVEAAAAAGPLLIVFEDLHWLPPAGLAVVEELVEGLEAAPVLVVATARPSILERAARWVGGSAHLRLELGPLPSSDARRLLRQVLPPETSSADVEALAIRAEGNPLFLRELGLARADGESASVPPTIEAVMLARLDRRPPLEREVLRAAAVFGRTFWQAGVERLLGRAAGVAEALAALARGRFVLPQPQSELPGQQEWRFGHALLQAAVLGSVGRRALRAWHARAALWLSAEVPGSPIRWARVAAHRSAAGDQVRAVAAWLVAAPRPPAGLAPAEAAEALAAALAEDSLAGGALSPKRRAEVETQLAQRRQLEGDLVAAAALLDAAIGRADAPEARAERLRLRAEVDEARGDLAAARRRLAEAWALVADRPEAGQSRATLRRDEAWLWHRDGDYERAVEALEEALATVEAEDHARVGPIRNVLGVVASGRGDYDEADRQYRLALRAFEALGEVRRVSAAYNNLGILAMRQGDYAGAADWFSRGLRIKAELGDREGVARAYNNLGTLHGEMGDYVKAARYLGEAVRIRERWGHGGLAVSYANLGEVYLKQGRHAEAGEHLERAIASCEAGRGPGYLLPDAWRMLAELRLALAEPEAAAEAARAALRLAEDSGDRPRAQVAGRVLAEALAALEPSA